jgi:hypothetical protein
MSLKSISKRRLSNPKDLTKRALAMRVELCFTLLLLVTLGATAYGQNQPISVQEATEDDYSIPTVTYLMKQPTGLGSGFAEKQVNRLGDRVSIALLKILDETDFRDSQKVKSILPLIRASFLLPRLIKFQEDRNPKVTLFMLQKIESAIEDAKLKSDITELIEFIKEKTVGYEQKR